MKIAKFLADEHSAEASLSGRQSEIVECVKSTGFASINELAERFAVTTQTIRRDVNELCEHQLLARYHGGVGLPTSIENEPYDERRDVLSQAKEEIALQVAQLIPDRASLFLNIGTTTEAVARALLGHRDLRIVTNNIHIIQILRENDSFDIMVAGGSVRNRDGGIIGDVAVDFFSGFRLDFGVIGISGIDFDGSLLDFDYREVRVTQTIVENARHVILVADHSKFGRSAMVRVGSATQVNTLVTDREPPAEYLDALQGAGVDCRWPQS